MRKQPSRRVNASRSAPSLDAQNHDHFAHSGPASNHDDDDNNTASNTLPDDYSLRTRSRPLSPPNATNPQSAHPPRAATRTPPMTRSRNRQKFTSAYMTDDDGDDCEGDEGFDERAGSPSEHASRMRFSRSQTNKQNNITAGPAPVDPIDNDIFARTMLNFNEEGFTRERTPGTSPNRKRQRVYGDR